MMLFAKLLVSPMPHARVTRLDTSRALAMPGVKAILTADGCPRCDRLCARRKRASRRRKPRRGLTNEPLYQGEPILAVAATSESDRGRGHRSDRDPEFEPGPLCQSSTPFESLRPYQRRERADPRATSGCDPTSPDGSRNLPLRGAAAGAAAPPAAAAATGGCGNPPAAAPPTRGVQPAPAAGPLAQARPPAGRSRPRPEGRSRRSRSTRPWAPALPQAPHRLSSPRDGASDERTPVTVEKSIPLGVYTDRTGVWRHREDRSVDLVLERDEFMTATDRPSYFRTPGRRWPTGGARKLYLPWIDAQSTVRCASKAAGVAGSWDRRSRRPEAHGQDQRSPSDTSGGGFGSNDPRLARSRCAIPALLSAKRQAPHGGDAHHARGRALHRPKRTRPGRVFQLRERRRFRKDGALSPRSTYAIDATTVRHDPAGARADRRARPFRSPHRPESSAGAS